jgi:DNA polymerase-1
MKEFLLFPGRGVLGRSDIGLPVRLVFGPGATDKDIFILKSHIQNIHKRKSFVERAPSSTARSVSIIVGESAILQELGRKLKIDNTRRGLVWQETVAGRAPAFWVHDQEKARSNRFFGEEFTSDIAYAVKYKEDAPHYANRFYTVETAEDAAFVDQRLRSSPWCAYDCETAGVVYSDYFEIHCLAVSTAHGETYVWKKDALQKPEITATLLSWFCDPTCKKVGHNIKFDMHAVQGFFGVPVRGFHSDTRLRRKLLHADAESSLEICSDLVGMGGYKQEFEVSLAEAKQAIKQARSKVGQEMMKLVDLSDHTALQQAVSNPKAKAEVYAYALVDDKTTALYCARDAYTTALLERKLSSDLVEQPHLMNVWENVVSKAAPAIQQIEAGGVMMDTAAMEELRVYLNQQREGLRSTLRARGLEEPDSSKQVSEYLFDELELKPTKISEKTNRPSTGASVLKALQGQSEDAAMLLEYRRLSKLADAYGESLPKHIRKDGRIHPEFVVDGTRTGRMSCRNPNLQQVPKSESQEGKLLKNCFVAPPGKLLIELDYSQMEMRVAAMLSGDQVMADMFATGEDFHLSTAKLIAKPMWGMNPEDIVKSSPQRNAAKQFNFGLLYGMTVNGLAQRIKCERSEAQKLRTVIFGEWRALAAWLDEQKQQAVETGRIFTQWNGKAARIRYVPGILSSDGLTAFKARNAAINTPVQGTASDYCLASVARIVDGLRDNRLPAQVVLTVHDSIIIEAEETAVLDVAKFAKTAMLEWPSGIVQFQVDVKAGPRWGSMEELHV